MTDQNRPRSFAKRLVATATFTIDKIYDLVPLGVCNEFDSRQEQMRRANSLAHLPRAHKNPEAVSVSEL